jgi:Uracil-DNA glycosylase
VEVVIINKVLFVGLSDKIGCTPLQSGTISGDLIDKIIVGINAECHKANLVNFAPLDEKGKLRYPTKSEMDIGYEYLQELIREVNPDICILLGDKVSKYLSNKLNSISIKHPSYIAVYKRKYIDEYIDGSINTINSILNGM